MILLSYECLKNTSCMYLLFFFSICLLVNNILGQMVKQFLSFLLLIAELSCFNNFIVPPEVNKNASLEILIGIALKLNLKICENIFCLQTLPQETVCLSRHIYHLVKFHYIYPVQFLSRYKT